MRSTEACYVNKTFVERLGYTVPDVLTWDFIFEVSAAAMALGKETVIDKNGKEIYEGDILRGDEYPYNCDGVDNYFVEIVWADNVCGFYRITHKKPNSTVRGISHGSWSELDEEDIKSFEVIGNIHDNPELLKAKTL